MWRPPSTDDHEPHDSPSWIVRVCADRLEHGDGEQAVVGERIAEVRDALDRLEADSKRGRV
jgi:hypothetical protein